MKTNMRPVFVWWNARRFKYVDAFSCGRSGGGVGVFDVFKRLEVPSKLGIRSHTDGFSHPSLTSET